MFRTIPSDEETGRQLADLAGRQGFRRVGIFYREGSYGEGLAMHLKNRAVSLGVSVGEELAYRPQDDPEYQGVLREWKESRLGEGSVHLRCLGPSMGHKEAGSVLLAASHPYCYRSIPILLDTILWEPS